MDQSFNFNPLLFSLENGRNIKGLLDYSLFPLGERVRVRG
jgi:hypothetical protein